MSAIISKILPIPSLKFLVSIFLSGISLTSLGQTEISGTLNDEIDGEALIGASVIIKGTTTGTTTDIEGNFKLVVDQTPVTLLISYIGYITKEVVVQDANQAIKIKLSADNISLKTFEVRESRITEKQKESPVTVEAMDIIAVKETPSASFYDGLGNLKGVDLTAASMGFKVINTRGFNSTRPVRSLQLIDGVDNQAPGLNFSVGNFAGVSELDIQKVELIVGANSALYGPNAFNGVISMQTKSPFIHQGLSVVGKVGERNLRETALRYAQSHRLWGEEDNIAYKLNVSYMEADDWEADNYNPTEDSDAGANNPGGFDAVNIYADEDRLGNISDFNRRTSPGLGYFYRTGYQEKDLVDYDTKNLKISPSLHFKLTEDLLFKYTFNYGSGTTVYQGDNRYSLKDLQIQQHVAEIGKKDKFFIRAYHTKEDAGKSYDAVFTALLLQRAAKSDANFQKDYLRYWGSITSELEDSLRQLGYPPPIMFGVPFDHQTADSVIAAHPDLIEFYHKNARQFADGIGDTIFREMARFEPGSPEFDSAFQSITSKRTFLEGGSGFYDKSSLTHYQGEYQFDKKELKIDHLKARLGASYRIYRPNSGGTIFLDTGSTKITNSEYGIYSSIEKRILEQKLILTATGRMDKNENFDALFSPAGSIVYLLNKDHTFRASFSSAIRNPTLQDQYLYYNIGRAILIGNLNGYDSLVTLNSYGDYIGSSFQRDTLNFFNIRAVRPEKVKSVEIGYKGALHKNLYLDASYYYSWYTDFLGYKVGADLTFDTLTGRADLGQTQIYRVSANSPDQVTTQGFSVGLNYYLLNYYSISGNYSYNILDRNGSDDDIIPAFNTPTNKYNIGFSGRDINLKAFGRVIRYFGFNVTYKWIQGFLFEGSPQFTGRIPDYDLLDAQINYRIAKINTTFKLGASNVLDKRSFQTYGGPRIGRLAYLSVLVEIK